MGALGSHRWFRATLFPLPPRIAPTSLAKPPLPSAGGNNGGTKTRGEKSKVAAVVVWPRGSRGLKAEATQPGSVLYAIDTLRRRRQFPAPDTIDPRG
jgi:hypothetical protein